MAVYLICGCLEEGGMICLHFACTGCCRAALAVAWALAAPAVAAHHFLAALGRSAVPGASAPLVSGKNLLIVSLKARMGKGLCIFG